MKSEQRFSLALLALLNDIKTELLASTNDSEKLLYDLKNEKEATRLGLEPTKDAQRKLLYKLEALGAFKIELVDHPYFPLSEQREAFDGAIAAPNQLYLHINQTLLDELYTEYDKKAAVQPSDKKVTVRLVKDGLNLYLQVSDGQRIEMKRLRTDLTPDKLLDYLLAHPNTIILIENLKLEGKGFGSIGNAGEILRKAGFTPTVKKYFLPDNDQKKVRLLNEAEMNSNDLEKIKAELSQTTKSE